MNFCALSGIVADYTTPTVPWWVILVLMLLFFATIFAPVMWYLGGAREKTARRILESVKPIGERKSILCRYCGVENESDAVFCKRCGKKIA